MERTAVYRFFDADGVLLYVGCSKRPADRRWQHNADKAWASNIAHTTLTWFDDREAALRAESAAIYAEQPRHNTVGIDPGKTPTYTFRIDPALRKRAKAAARARGMTLTDVVRDGLERYADGAT